MFKLRTLSGLLAFDAAARHSSLTLAAKELGRTQSAVSQQVKALEQEVGFALFVRKPRAISLTPEGRQISKAVRAAFEGIEKTITEQSQKDEPNILRLTTYQSFAIHWLIPRLPRFSLLHPEIDVQINADDQRLDLRAEGFDLAIRVGSCPSTGKKLAEEQFAPVYAPSISPDRPILAQDIGKAPILAHRYAHFWDQWLEQNGQSIEKLQPTMDYSHSGLLVQAAAAGGGVALAPLAIADEAIRSGRLKYVRGKALATKYCYFTESAIDPEPEKVRVFTVWLHNEMALMLKGLAEYLD